MIIPGLDGKPRKEGGEVLGVPGAWVKALYAPFPNPWSIQEVALQWFGRLFLNPLVI